MAIILMGRSCCSICGEVLAAGQNITATSGCAFPPEHHLRNHCDAGMHWECFWNWPDRNEFSRGYVQATVDGYGKAYAAALVHSDLDCVLLVEPAKRASKPEDSGPTDDPRVHVLLWTTNAHCLLTASQWEDWLRGPATGRPGEAPILSEVRSRLSKLFPRAEELLNGIDVKAHVLKQQAFAEEMAIGSNRRAEQMERQAQEVESHNEELDGVCRQQPDCPRCGASWERLRYYDLRGKGRLSCVICQGCERSSRLSEFFGNVSSRGKPT